MRMKIYTELLVLEQSIIDKFIQLILVRHFSPSKLLMHQLRQYQFDRYQSPVQLPHGFFIQLLKSEELYHKNRDKQTMGILLAKYTDLVAYFQAKQQPATEYFQAKIKALLQNVRYFTNSETDREANRKKMNLDMLNVMETKIEEVKNDIKKDMDKQRRMSDKVSKIIADQQFQLEKRIKASRRGRCKHTSRKTTLSFASLSSIQADLQFISPEKKRETGKITSSCVDPKKCQDEDLQKYFQEGAIITTNFLESEGQQLTLPSQEKIRNFLTSTSHQ